MSEKPILFSTDMVRAILDGRKTQTRRVIKPQPIQTKGAGVFLGWTWKTRKVELRNWIDDERFGKELVAHCPYRVGDLLWVRETWRVNAGLYYCREHNKRHSWNIEYAPFKGNARGDDIWICLDEERDIIKANHYYEKHKSGCYSPSIHMPKWAARIWLEVTDVRVERVQDISNHNIMCEGCQWDGPLDEAVELHSQAWITLWDSLNAKRGYSWESNPWVWAITFKRIDRQMPKEME